MSFIQKYRQRYKQTYFSLNHFNFEDKIVLLRVDFNVPIEKGKIKDNSKIKAVIPTIKELLKRKCKIVLMTHLGRPEGKFVEEFKVDPLAGELQKILHQVLPKEKVVKFDDCIGNEIKEMIIKGREKIYLLENLRFYPEEEKNDAFFAHSLAGLGDIYVNDAFSVSHRQHASVDKITHYLPSFAGLMLEKEIFYLNKALHPKEPTIWIFGGGKLDKIELMKKALKKSYKVLIGGALCFSFLKAKGIDIGHSKIDSSSLSIAKKILRSRNAKKIILPVDFRVAEKFQPHAKTKIVSFNNISNGEIALDLGPETTRLFIENLKKANTIIWNGPLGYFEWVQFAESTKEVGRALGKLNAVSICGGGETAEALKKFHLEDNVTYLSLSGGAALEYLSEKKLPGIIALQKNFKRFRKRAHLHHQDL